MMCRKPYLQGTMPFGCGQCTPCRINRRRLWSHRMLLESYCHEKACFATFTYDSQFLPPDGSLDHRHVQLFFKRLRKHLSFRYFVVGEYGDQTWRPHYHAALFGVGVDDEDLVRDTWGKGHVMLGDLTPASASYIAGYVVKKFTFKDDPRLGGRRPEYARMSLKPGIGAFAMDEISRLVLEHEHVRSDFVDTGDVPNRLRHGVKYSLLGRYLRSVLRKKIGIVDGKTPKAVLERYALEMRDMFALALQDPIARQKSYSEILVSQSQAKMDSVEARYNIYQSQKRSGL